jgi:hypothetical protein
LKVVTTIHQATVSPARFQEGYWEAIIIILFLNIKKPDVELNVSIGQHFCGTPQGVLLGSAADLLKTFDTTLGLSISRDKSFDLRKNVNTN